MSFKSLFDYWSSSYYTIPFCILTAMIGLTLFFLKKDKRRATQIFVYYFISYVLLSLIFSASAVVINKSQRHALIIADRFSDYIFTLIEFLIFFLFFQKTLERAIHRKVLKIICFVFLLIGIILLVRDTYLKGLPQLHSTHLLFNLQVLGLLVPCIFYYVEVFRLKPMVDLFHEPSFWVTTGLIFFMICTFPLSLSTDYLYKTNQILYRSLFSLFYIFYILLFLMIIRGHLCKPGTK